MATRLRLGSDQARRAPEMEAGSRAEKNSKRCNLPSDWSSSGGHARAAKNTARKGPEKVSRGAGCGSCEQGMNVVTSALAPQNAQLKALQTDHCNEECGRNRGTGRQKTSCSSRGSWTAKAPAKHGDEEQGCMSHAEAAETGQLLGCIVSKSQLLHEQRRRERTGVQLRATHRRFGESCRQTCSCSGWCHCPPPRASCTPQSKQRQRDWDFGAWQRTWA